MNWPLGYSTLYGDMCGAYNPIGDLYKTEIFDLYSFLAQSKSLPLSILNKPPSAELRPEQLDSDSLPPYNLLDPWLIAYLDNGADYEQLVELGAPEDTVNWLINTTRKMEFKRFQAPPILHLRKSAFGFGWHWPLNQGYGAWNKPE